MYVYMGGRGRAVDLSAKSVDLWAHVADLVHKLTCIRKYAGNSSKVVNCLSNH